MILKKPYAFLIKNFKKIHLILFVLLAFICFRTYNVVTFFNDYFNKGFYKFENNLASSYVDFYMIIVIVLIVVFSAILYLLLKFKNKNRLYYIVVAIFYLVLFIGLVFLYSQINIIEATLVDKRTIRMDRDISLIMFLPQLFFLAYTLLRGIGFDIKKFNFNKDLEELNVEVSDDEEFEFIVGTDGYKIKRKARRTWREIRYYILENKYFFMIIFGIIIVVLGFIIYLNTQVFNKVYKEKQNFVANSLKFNIEDSYLTNIDYKGEIISKNKYYLVTKVTINNRGYNDEIIDKKDFRLMVNDTKYYPTYTKNESFIDLGKGYDKDKLLKQDYATYLFVFEIDKEDITKEFILRIVNNVNLTQGEISAEYKDTKIEPELLNKVSLEGEYNVKEQVLLGETNLKKTSITINSYQISNSFIQTYDYCIETTCYKGIDTIKDNSIGTITKTVLKLDLKYSPDENVYASSVIKTGKNFIDSFGTISYELNGVKKISRIKDISPNYLISSILYLSIPKEIELATNVKLVLTIRNLKYEINLK